MTAGDKEFRAVVRIDSPGEADYYRHGGIMQYVLRSLLPYDPRGPPQDYRRESSPMAS